MNPLPTTPAAVRAKLRDDALQLIARRPGTKYVEISRALWEERFAPETAGWIQTVKVVVDELLAEGVIAGAPKEGYVLAPADTPAIGLADPVGYSDGSALRFRCPFCVRELVLDPHPGCCGAAKYEVIPEVELPLYDGAAEIRGAR